MYLLFKTSGLDWIECWAHYLALQIEEVAQRGWNTDMFAVSLRCVQPKTCHHTQHAQHPGTHTRVFICPSQNSCAQYPENTCAFVCANQNPCKLQLPCWHGVCTSFPWSQAPVAEGPWLFPKVLSPRGTCSLQDTLSALRGCEHQCRQSGRRACWEWVWRCWTLIYTDHHCIIDLKMDCMF